MRRRKLRRHDGKIVEAVEGADGHWYVSDEQVGDWLDDVKQVFVPASDAASNYAASVQKQVTTAVEASTIKTIVILGLLFLIAKKGGLR